MTDSSLTLIQYKEFVISQIKDQRTERLDYDVLAEYPPGSGNLFSCSTTSQINWGNLTVLDDRELVTYPFTVTTADEMGSYTLTSSSDLTNAVATISAAVITERAYAQSFIDAVNAAPDQAGVDAAAAPYLNL